MKYPECQICAWSSFYALSQFKLTLDIFQVFMYYYSNNSLLRMRGLFLFGWIMGE